MTDPSSWKVVGASVRGASHLRSGLPNQDAIGWNPKPGEPGPLVIAVSDGHGSNRCFRSDVGATLAVQSALRVMTEFVGTQTAPIPAQSAEAAAREVAAPQLVAQWRAAVEIDLQQRALSGSELDSLQERDGLGARQSVESDPIVAYGATLLTVLVTDSLILYLQLGDGDIVVVAEGGKAYRPLPKDERLLGNETTSLCLRDAWLDFRVAAHALEGELPALVMLSTDGYVNSFSDDRGFLKVGADLLQIIRTEGLESVNANLASWLSETSRLGSGDDITVGIVCSAGLIGCAQRTGTEPSELNR